MTVHTINAPYIDTMSGNEYPLNLAEMCWRLGLRTPELIQQMHQEHQTQIETIRTLQEQLQTLQEQLQTNQKKSQESPESPDHTINTVVCYGRRLEQQTMKNA